MKTIGRYKILKTLDATGLGEVYLAEDPVLGRKVAIKVLSRPARAAEARRKRKRGGPAPAPKASRKKKSRPAPDKAARERARRAARLVARLDHPGIVALYDFGEMSGRPYFVFEYLEGRSLADLVEKGEAPPLLVTLRIMAAIAGALQHAHENGVVHRDVKPANVIISPKGEPVLSNFLLAAAPSDDPLEGGGELAGTPAYMSPEQARGEPVTHLADIWSLGAALFHVLAGRAPYESGTSQELVERIASPEPVDLSPLGRGPVGSTAVTGRRGPVGSTTVTGRRGLPEFVTDIIARCLDKAPEARFRTADELRRALEAAIDHVELSEDDTAELAPPRQGQTLLLHVEYQDADVRGSYREYEVAEHLGGGRFGDVYRAVEKLSGRTLALKFLKREWIADADTVARFRREARVLSQISHPNVVFVHNFGRYGPSFFIAMDLLGKRTLCDVIEERCPMDVEEAVAHFDPVLAGLEACHRAGVVHRDLKPENIAVVDARIVIFDFGIAYVSDARRLTTSGFFVGTPSYASPEQASAREVTGAADVYAAGVVLYEMLSDRLPHEGDSAYALLNRIATEPPVPITEWRRDVPETVRVVLDRMLAKGPEERPTAAEARRLLAEVS